MSDYYVSSGSPAAGAPGNSAPIRSQYDLISAGFDKLPALTGATLEIVRVNAGETALESITSAALAAALKPDLLEVADAVDDAASVAATVTHTTSGTPATGIGVGLAFAAETSASNNEIGMVLEAVTTVVTGGLEDFDLVAKLMAAGATAAEAMRVTSTGIFSLAGNIIISGADLAGQITGSSLTSLGTIGSLVATSAAISGGTIDNTAIGGTTACTIDDTIIGGTTAVAGSFTTLSGTTSITGPDSGQWNSTGMVIGVGKVYNIGLSTVLNATTLGTAVVTSSLETVATIGTGVWEGTDVAVAHGGTGVSTLTDNGILLGSGTGAITAMTAMAKGSLVVGATAADPTALAVGATNGFGLAVDSGEATGLIWQAINAATVASATQSTGVTHDYLTAAQFVTAQGVGLVANTAYFIIAA
jgi:hypothetical protein